MGNWLGGMRHRFPTSTTTSSLPGRRAGSTGWASDCICASAEKTHYRGCIPALTWNSRFFYDLGFM